MAEYDSVIPAGQSGKLTAKIHTRPTQHGRLSKGISVTTDAPGAENLRLTLTMEVKAAIFVKPRFQLYVNTVAGATSSSRVLLRRSDGEKLEVKPGKKIADNITVEVKPAKEGETVGNDTVTQKGDLWVEATVIEPKTVNTRTEKVVLETNHPDMKVLEIPLTIRVRSQIEARPGQVRFVITDQSKAGQSTNFRLSHNSGGTFEISGVTSSNEKVFTVEQTSAGVSKSHMFKVKLAEGFDASTLTLPLNGAITVHTNSSAAPRIRVPVLISERAKPKPRTPQRRPGQEYRRTQPRPPKAGPTRTPKAG